MALRYALDIGMPSIEQRIRDLANSLRERLKREPGVSLMDLGRVENQCGIISFAVPGIDPDHIKQGLREQRVYVSTSSAGSTPLDAQDRALPTVVSGRLLRAACTGVVLKDLCARKGYCGAGRRARLNPSNCHDALQVLLCGSGYRMCPVVKRAPG